MTNKKILISALIFGLMVSIANFLINRAIADVGASLGNLTNQPLVISDESTANTATPTEPVSDVAPTTTTSKHKIAYWWGKVNQHTEAGEWTTDPDGVSGANINRYVYCKKWYPTTVQAVYDGREYIEGFQNAGNTGWYAETPVTYHCTEIEATADYEAQKMLYRSGQEIEAILSSGEVLKVKIVASSLRQDFDTCGDTRIRFEVNGQYATRFLCVDEHDSITVDNERVKITLNSIIHGAGVTYAVADIVKSDETITPTEPTEPTEDTAKREKIKDIFKHIKDIKLYSTPKVTSKTIEIVTQSGQEYLLYIIRGNYFGENGDVKIGNKWLHSEVLFRSDNLIIAIVDPSVNGEIIVSRAKHAAEMLDTDRDGLPDEWEETLGTNAVIADSDADGYEDGVEVENQYDPSRGFGQEYTEVDLSDLE